MPFTLDGVPIELVASGKMIPQWQLDDVGLVGLLQPSPVKTDTPREQITLVPMGAARLRISAFPVVGEGPDAQPWKSPPQPLYRASASHCNESDTVRALCDQRVPSSSNDQGVPRMTWWPHKGTAEWVEYDLGEPQSIAGVRVYWFDDTAAGGGCGLPAAWKLLYKAEAGQWKPVENAADYGLARDQFNQLDFPSVRTSGLRLEVQLPPNQSGGILEWEIMAAK